MRNHDEKIKDMQRSVLPSTARQRFGAERAAIHRRARRRSRQALHALVLDGNFEDLDSSDYTAEPTGAIAEMVGVRREHDKIAPLCRWAERTVAADPALATLDPEAQIDHFAGLLPDTVIGRHAVSHVEWALWRSSHRWWLNGGRPLRREAPVESLAGLARRALVEGRHGELNRALKAAATTWRPGGKPPRWITGPPRLLAGHHDVEAFVAAITGRPEARVLERIAGGPFRR